MLSGYPSLASNLAADKAYVESGFMDRMAEFVEHGRLLQVDVDVNSLPLESEMLRIETYSSALGGEGMVEGVELGKGGAREKVWLGFTGLRHDDVKQIVGDGAERFQTVCLSKILG
jgi:hypothetical protein